QSKSPGICVPGLFARQFSFPTRGINIPSKTTSDFHLLRRHRIRQGITAHRGRLCCSLLPFADWIKNSIREPNTFSCHRHVLTSVLEDKLCDLAMQPI